ncbi:MAG: hypothetical protein IJ571_02315 [Ruminococcus sp.]|nr:hypothetical protein [Ruminococcus sp.]
MKYRNSARKKWFKRAVSVVTSLLILASGLCTPELVEDIEDIVINANAYSPVGHPVKNIDSLTELYEFSQNYQSDPDYQFCTLSINFNDSIILSPTRTIDDTQYTFTPIGTKSKPFCGRLKLSTQSGMSRNIQIDNTTLFGYVNDSVEIISNSGGSIPINLVRTDATKNTPLFAEHVVHDGTQGATTATWILSTTASEQYSGFIGTVESGASVDIDLTVDSSADIVADDNVGLICGTMETNSTVDVEFKNTTAPTINTITSNNGSAGVFVGEMKTGSALNIYLGEFELTSSARTIKGDKYAGGLVGKNDQGTVTLKNSETDTDELVFDAAGTIDGGTAAGGVFGYYKIPSDNDKFSPTYYKSTNGCTLKGATAGGLVGVLEGNGNDVSYSGTVTEENDASVISVVSSLSGSNTTSYGGIVGQYSNNSLEKEFTVEHTNVTMSGSGATNYGGVAGLLGSESDVYIKADDFTLTSNSGASGCTNFGGVIGNTGDKSNMIDVGDLTVVVKKNNALDQFVGGGVVGQLSRGVLRLSGVTDLSQARCDNLAKDKYTNRGQLVGNRTDALVYALGSGNDTTASYGKGWRFIRSETEANADDIGTWGEVVRLEGMEGAEAIPAVPADPEADPPVVGSPAVPAKEKIVTFDSSAHTVTVEPAVINMKTERDFVKTAINMQLNDSQSTGALLFDSGSNRTDLLENTGLTVSGIIDLSGTGITGFMRDGNDTTNIKSFTGTLSKGSANEDSEEEAEDVAEIKLAVGEVYGISSNSNGGKIFGHKYNGLFACTGDGAAINNVDISGTMNINAYRPDIYIGGAVAYVNGSATLTNVDAKETINYYVPDTNNDFSKNHYVGGIIGATVCAEGEDVTIGGEDEETKATINPTINVTGKLWSNINGNDKTVVYQSIGGLIGYIKGTGKATTKVQYITLSANIDASGATEAANVSTAGLIADIAWNSTDTRSLVLNDIDVENTQIKNTATTETGGILGYRWYGTDVTFDDVVLVADSGNEINSPSNYVGGLVYRATGHWKINANGIDIEDIAIKNGNATAAPTGLGVILHDGFYSTTSGIFMEFMADDSYTLASGLSYIPDMTATGKIYDEICACLSNEAAGILTNNTAGVISYYTTDGVYTSGDEIKNSYNNIYNTTVVNNRSRYYYNADIETYNFNRSDPGYQLLYWSLNRYAAANIKHCFIDPTTNKSPFSDDVLTGTFDLKNISYYPIDISKNVSIGDATFIFYNSQIEESEMSEGTKRSTRDGKSQHYMMHMGLFRNVSATITTTGNITLYGSVGVDNSYSGALINGLLTGTLNTAAAKNINLGDAYNQIPLEISDINRYLFINKIGDKAVLDLNGLYITGVAYDTSDDTTYASSLIGDVQGAGINLTFNNIRIDGRNKENVTITGTSASDKNGTYATSKSIFSNATLLNKLDVDSTSVAVYNFSQKEDWGTNNPSMAARSKGYGKVTFGRELTDSVEYEDEENRYYEDGENGNYIAPVTYPGKYDSATAPLGTAYDFSSDYLPYVRYFTSDTTKIASPPAATYTLREIKVNVVPSDLKDGCGTYDHPYSITSAKQLAAVATMLDYTNSAATALIPNIMLPETNDGTHWCCTDSTGTGAQEKNMNSCLLFTYDGGLRKYKHDFTTTTTDQETGEETTTVVRTATWDINDVRKYLASAYYQIGTSITLGSTFTGLGAYDSEYAFKGVIVGLNNNITVTNNTTTPFIKVSNGSVVKDLKIVVSPSGTPTFGKNGSASTQFGYTNESLFYGGVMGEIMGGDNIIDNVSMTYSNNGFIKTLDSCLMCVGGYVGVIVNGGLIFRNMTSNHFNTDTFKVNKDGATTNINWVLDENNITAHSRLFVNPYVGRVINGYAINETTKYSGDSAAVKDEDGNDVYKYYDADGKELTDVTDPENDDRIADRVQQYKYDETVNDVYTLDNGTKNYQIANVKVDVSDSEKLYYDKYDDKNRVNIPNGQSLFILSLITQSGAGTATTADGAYVYGVAYDGETQFNTKTAAKNAATHLAKYDHVGDSSLTIDYKTNTSGDYYLSTGDKNGLSTAVPYIISHYTKADTNGNYPARMMTGNTEFMKLSNAGITYNLPASFRGIGSICRLISGNPEAAEEKQSEAIPVDSSNDEDGKFAMKIYGFEGNNSTINVNIIFNTYRNDADNYISTVYGKNKVHIGFGLFNYLKQKSNATNSDGNPTYNLSENYYVGNFTMTGNIAISEYESNGNASTGAAAANRDRYSVGGLSGVLTVNDYINLYRCDINNLKVKGTSMVGGYIGRSNVTERNRKNGSGMNYIYANGCNTNGLYITGNRGYCGGFIAGSKSGYLCLYMNTALNTKETDSDRKGTDGRYKSSIELSISTVTAANECGTGGILGSIRNGYDVELWVNNVTLTGCSDSPKIENTDTSAEPTRGVGGFFGWVRKAKSVIVTNSEVKNINITGPCAGGMLGYLANETNKTYFTYGESPKISIYNCKVYDDDPNNTFSLTGVVNVGGLAGYFITPKTYTDVFTGYDGSDYIYDVDGCEVYGYTISQTKNDDNNAQYGSGGLIGYAESAQRTIVNSSVHDCVIQAGGAKQNHGMGGVVGNTQRGIWGYNIASYNNTFAYNGSETKAKCGGFIGNTNGNELKIVGFTRKNNKMNDGTAVTLDWDANSEPLPGSYVIDADYMNVSTTANKGTAMAVGFGDVNAVGEGAAGEYFPYVTVSPKTTMGGENFLTGDGISLNNGTPLANLIVSENKSGAADNRIAYTTVSADDITAVGNMTDGDVKLTTYGAEMGLPAGYEENGGTDFPILAIGGQKTVNEGYDAEINAYIRVLTNTNDDYDYSESVAGKYKVDIYACQYINGKYQKVDNATPGLELNTTTGMFIMNDNNADSIAPNNQFSMIDISFFDPTDSSKVAYHLYVPVLTKKLLKFNFSSTALQGTEYEPEVYLANIPTSDNKTSKLGSSFDTWQTIYLKYDYTKDEIDKFLATGKGLKWNTTKSVQFSYNGTKSLDTSTEFVLLDNNNGVDKEYYKTKDNEDTNVNSSNNKYDVIKFAEFTTTRDKGTVSPKNSFTPQYLMYIAGDKIEYKEDATGAYIECSENDATVIAYSGTTKKFFKAVTGDTNDTKYTLTLKQGEVISETYYLSMYTYKSKNTQTAERHDAYYFKVECPTTFPSTVITCQKDKSKDTEIFLGNFLKQSLIITDVNEKYIINTDNHVLTATMQSVIEFDGDEDNKIFYNKNLAGEELYQGFFLYLNRLDEDGNPTSDCAIKTEPTYRYTRTVGGSEFGSSTSGGVDDEAPYFYVPPVTVKIGEYVEDSPTWTSLQTATVTLDFGSKEADLVTEFPPRTKTTDDQRGIRIDATSKIDFTFDGVAYSNIQQSYKTYRSYYIDRIGQSGVLTLTALEQNDNDGYDMYGEQSKNKSALGVNGKYINTGVNYTATGELEKIRAGLDYDVTNLPDEVFTDGSYEMTFTISLEQKRDKAASPGFEYHQVNIEDLENQDDTGYLKDLKLYDKDGNSLTLTPHNDESGPLYYTYTMPITKDKSQWTLDYSDTGAQRQFSSDVEFYVKTGSELEKIEDYLYSNYKFKVEVKVKKGATEYTDDDHIIYTNAKLNAQYVSATAG